MVMIGQKNLRRTGLPLVSNLKGLDNEGVEVSGWAKADEC